MIASTSPGEAWPDTPERICFVDFFRSFTSYDSDRQLNCSLAAAAIKCILSAFQAPWAA